MFNFLNISLILCNFEQGFGKVGVLEGRNETDGQLEDFEVFNVRNTVNIIAYSVMSAGKKRLLSTRDLNGNLKRDDN